MRKAVSGTVHRPVGFRHQAEDGSNREKGSAGQKGSPAHGVAPEQLGRRDGTCRVSFYPENERTASRRQPPDKGGGPDSNRGRAAFIAVCERDRGECNRADAPRPRPGDRVRSVAPGGPAPAVRLRCHTLLMLDAGHPWSLIASVLFTSSATCGWPVRPATWRRPPGSTTTAWAWTCCTSWRATMGLMA
jgi:hypothetical protein